MADKVQETKDEETILKYSYEDEAKCGANFAQLERENPEVAERANKLCKKLGLYGFWKRVNSARWEIAKALLAEKEIYG